MSVIQYDHRGGVIRTFGWDRGSRNWHASYEIGRGPIVDLINAPFPDENAAHEAALKAAKAEIDGAWASTSWPSATQRSASGQTPALVAPR